VASKLGGLKALTKRRDGARHLTYLDVGFNNPRIEKSPCNKQSGG